MTIAEKKLKIATKALAVCAKIIEGYASSHCSDFCGYTCNCSESYGNNEAHIALRDIKKLGGK